MFTNIQFLMVFCLHLYLLVSVSTCTNMHLHQYLLVTVYCILVAQYTDTSAVARGYKRIWRLSPVGSWVKHWEVLLLSTDEMEMTESMCRRDFCTAFVTAAHKMNDIVNEIETEKGRRPAANEKFFDFIC